MEARPILIAGMLLWRGGLLLVLAYSSYRGMLELLRWVELPRQLEVGAALGLGGFLLVLASLVVERVKDARTEGDLGE